MKKILFFSAAVLALAGASCTNDEPAGSNSGKSNEIGFSVIADKGTRSSSSYLNGIDIKDFTVSAWIIKDSISSPNYSESNENNTTYFLNDYLTRSENSGLFNYTSGARYWPANGEMLDFFAVVDNPLPFTFDAKDSRPGIKGKIKQMQINEMPDMLFAYAPNQHRNGQAVAQQNVSLRFNHAFAKVVVTAEVKNPNLRVCITDMAIVGIADEGQFLFPCKVQQDNKIVHKAPEWLVGSGFTSVTNLLAKYNDENPAVLDMGNDSKLTLLGEDAPNDLLVLPTSYSGRNEYKPQTYIQLKGYAYNISDSESGFRPGLDALIYPKKNADGSFTPATIVIPIEFDWKIGTINRYNITFDCGNGGLDPENPAFVRIGYEVEINPWTEGENIWTEYKK